MMGMRTPGLGDRSVRIFCLCVGQVRVVIGRGLLGRERCGFVEGCGVRRGRTEGRLRLLVWQILGGYSQTHLTWFVSVVVIWMELLSCSEDRQRPSWRCGAIIRPVKPTHGQQVSSPFAFIDLAEALPHESHTAPEVQYGYNNAIYYHTITTTNTATKSKHIQIHIETERNS